MKPKAMTIEEFENKIQEEIHPNLWISKNEKTSDVAGVYMGNHYLSVGVPQRLILPGKTEAYKDRGGVKYRGIKEAVHDINQAIHHY